MDFKNYLMVEHTVSGSNSNLEKWEMHVYVLVSGSQSCVRLLYKPHLPNLEWRYWRQLTGELV